LKYEVFKQTDDADFEHYKKSCEDFVNNHKRLFNSFAEDISIKFEMGDAFFIDYERGYISLDSKWFFEKGYNKEQILWATFHELAHFRDLIQDKEGVVDGFEYIKEKAGALAESSGMNEQLAYNTYHTLFNCLDDIYVNRVVSRQASFYEADRQGGKQVEQLYKEKLFKDNDFAKEHDRANALPHHLQFAYYLLRKAMLPQEEVKISDEVKNALQTRIEVDTKSYTPEELIRSFMVPGRSKDSKATIRHEYLKKYLEPLYEELIRKDLEEGDNKDPQSSDQSNQGDGEDSRSESQPSDTGENGPQADSREPGTQGQPTQQRGDKDQGESDENKSASHPQQNQSDSAGNEQKRMFEKWSNIHNEFASNSPDQIEQEQIEKFIEQEQSKNEERKVEKSKSKSEKESTDIQTSADKMWAEKNEIRDRDIYHELQKLREIEESIIPHLNSLTELWQSIVAGRSSEFISTKDTLHTSGQELNIDSVIENMGSIYAGQSTPRIYEKNIVKERSVNKPELIRVRLIVDKSGSMDEEVKQKVLQQVLVLVLRSIQQFNEMLDLTRSSTGSKLRAETQVLGFSDTLTELKKLESELDEDKEPTLEVLNVLQQSGAENGGTYDDLALDHVLNNQDDSNKQKIDNGKILDILFEITDGGSSRAEESKKAVSKMEEVGIHANAFQIGEVGAGEKETFNEVWNNSGIKRGLVIGTDIEKLVPAVAEALKKYLHDVKV